MIAGPQAFFSGAGVGAATGAASSIMAGSAVAGASQPQPESQSFPQELQGSQLRRQHRGTGQQTLTGTCLQTTRGTHRVTVYGTFFGTIRTQLTVFVYCTGLRTQ